MRGVFNAVRLIVAVFGIGSGIFLSGSHVAYIKEQGVFDRLTAMHISPAVILIGIVSPLLVLSFFEFSAHIFMFTLLSDTSFTG